MSDRRAHVPCPGMKRDGRCAPGAWLCQLCGRWHYLKRNPVRRGTLPRTRRFATWDRL